MTLEEARQAYRQFSFENEENTDYRIYFSSIYEWH